ncbi:MAG: hypothetical protein KDD41_00730 [Flavobacteriales bacterium]|nr:hypothetical protein [Flavobacteriales bacterium]
MKINTQQQIVNESQQVVFDFLMDMNNFEELFPQDKIKEWQATEDSCSCEIKNMGKIGLKRVASTPHSLIYLDSTKTPFKFTLNLFIEAAGENQSKAHLEFDAEINPFMKMMIEKPLTDFFNNLVLKLAHKFN